MRMGSFTIGYCSSCPEKRNVQAGVLCLWEALGEPRALSGVFFGLSLTLWEWTNSLAVVCASQPLQPLTLKDRGS